MSRPELVLILGNVRRGEYEAMLSAGLRLGVVLDEKRHATLPADDGFELAVSHDFSQPLDTLDPLLARIQRDFEVIAVVNLREFYVRALPYVARQLGLPGLPESAVDAVLNKTLMRRRFAQALGTGSAPRFREIANIEQALAFVDAVGYPVVLKPNNLYGSLFVRTVHDEMSLRQQLADLQAQVSAHVARLNVHRALEQTLQIEEFCSGTIHSIDCLVDAGGTVHPTPVVDVLTGFDVGQAHFGHVMRKTHSSLAPTLQAHMRQIGIRAIDALGLRSTAAHVEFIATPSGPKLLEIAARPGGHRNRVLDKSCGIELNHQYVRMLLGDVPDLEPRFDRPYCIVTPYPAIEMSFRGIRHLDRVRALRSYSSHEIKCEPEATIGPAAHGFMSSWLVELNHPDPDLLQSDIRWLTTFPDFFERSP